MSNSFTYTPTRHTQHGVRSSALSPFPPPTPAFAPRSSEVCKAVYKIEEAFSSRSWGLSPESVNCLDVGASPGSWTAFLAEKTTGTVLAVDPGDLKVRGWKRVAEEELIHNDDGALGVRKRRTSPCPPVANTSLVAARGAFPAQRFALPRAGLPVYGRRHQVRGSL